MAKDEATAPRKNMLIVGTRHLGRKFKLAVWVILGCIVLAAISGGVLWYRHAHRPALKPTIGSSNQYAQDITDLKQQPPPKDPISQAFYYNELAYDYQKLHQYADALRYYQKAQTIVDKGDLKLQSGVVSYRNIGDVYLALGNKAAAKEYYQKYISFLRTYKHYNSDDSIDHIIADVQKQMQKL